VQLTPARTRVSNGIVNSISYAASSCQSRGRVLCLIPTSVPFAMRMRADGIRCVFFAEWRRKRSKFKGLTKTTSECPRVRSAAGHAFLYMQNGDHGEPFRHSQPQNKPRPPTKYTHRLFTSQRRVFRCGVNQTSAKYRSESVLQASCTGGRSVVFDNCAFDIWKSSPARE